MCMLMWINTELMLLAFKQHKQTSPTSSAYRKSVSVVCCFFSWHYWSLLLWESRGAYSICECRVVQSHAGNISEQRVTSCVSMICCVSNWMEQLLMQHKFPRRSSGQCFRADSFLISGTSDCPPARLALQYQTTSTGAMLNATYCTWNISCQYRWPKQENSGVYSRDS